MNYFFYQQIDYSLFIISCLYIILYVLYLNLNNNSIQKFYWHWLKYFFLIQSIYYFLKLSAFSLNDNIYFYYLRSSIYLLSLLFLLEFIRNYLNSFLNKKFNYFSLIPFTIIFILGNFYFNKELSKFAGLILNILTVLLLLATILTRYYIFKLIEYKCFFYSGILLSLVLIIDSFINYSSTYSIINNIDTSLFKRIIFSSLYLLKIILLSIITLLCSLFSLIINSSEMSNNKLINFKRDYVKEILIVFLVLFGGWVLCFVAGFIGERGIYKEGNLTLNIIEHNLKSRFLEVENCVKLLSSSVNVIKFLNNPNNKNLEEANTVLDRYNNNFGFSVCYLINLRGITVASSNRKEKNSFVGKDYSFRPYFIDATNGKQGKYFALGITSKERGYYSSYPIYNENKKLIGVVVIKKNLDSIENFLKNYKYVFFTSPEGIIFLSGVSNYLYKTIKPIDTLSLSNLLKSQQFGNIKPTLIFSNYNENTKKLFFNDKYYYNFWKRFNDEGWAIVFLVPLTQVMINRFITILIFYIFIILLITSFIIRHKSKELQNKILESEKKFRMIFMNAPDSICIINLDNYEILDFNPKFSETFKYYEDDLLKGLKLSDLSDEDYGKNFIKILGEKSYKDKNRNIIYVDVSGIKIQYRNKDCLLAFIRDITDKKIDEQKLKETLIELESTNNQIRKDLDLARKLQEELLPKEGQFFNKLNCSIFFLPAIELGGDFYDFKQIDENNLYFIVADVSGHGVSSAFVAILGKALFQNLVMIHRNISDILYFINENLYKTLYETGYYMSACICHIDLEKMELNIGSAGHPEVILVKDINNILLIPEKKKHPGLGLYNNIKYSENKTKIKSGDKIIMYTDGLTELNNKDYELFGLKGLKKVIMNNYYLSPKSLSDVIIKEINDFKGDAEQHDDITLIIIEIK